MEECVLCGQAEGEHLDPAGEEYCRGLHIPEVYCTMCPTKEDLERMNHSIVVSDALRISGLTVL